MKRFIGFWKYIYYGLKEELTGSHLHLALTMPIDDVFAAIGRRLLKLFRFTVYIIVGIIALIISGTIGLLFLAFGLVYPVAAAFTDAFVVILLIMIVYDPDQFIINIENIIGGLKMTLNEVVSSNIKRVGYEDGKLLVEYLGGSQYEYTGVPIETFNEMMAAESKGRFLNANIKGKFDFKKVA